MGLHRAVRQWLLPGSDVLWLRHWASADLTSLLHCPLQPAGVYTNANGTALSWPARYGAKTEWGGRLHQAYSCALRLCGAAGWHPSGLKASLRCIHLPLDGMTYLPVPCSQMHL